MSNERGNDASASSVEPTTVTSTPVARATEAVPSAPAPVTAQPVKTDEVAKVHPLLANLDLRGIQADDWRVAKEAQQLASQKLSAKDVGSILQWCGLKDAEANKVVAFARVLQKANGSTPVYAELVAELRLAYFFAQHYDLDSDSYDVEERRPTNRNLLWRLRRVVEVCEELQDVRPEELRASGFSAQDLFQREPRTIDGVPVRTRLDIARWLNGPYANASKADEIKKLLPKLDLDLTADLDAQGSASSQLNLAAWSVLKADRLFCVYEEHENPALNPHAHLTFYPANGDEPVLLDFSFHQLTPQEKGAKDTAKTPFVGTRADLSAAAKALKAQGKITPLFDGQSRNAACQNVTPETITGIKQALSAREPDAVYN